MVHDDYPDNVVSFTSVIKAMLKTVLETAILLLNRIMLHNVDHAYLETEAGLAYYDSDGVLVVKSCDQDITHHRMLLAKILDMPINKIRVIMTPVGGGFGGKEDMICQGILAIAALKNKTACKAGLFRNDSMIGSCKRHPV